MTAALIVFALGVVATFVGVVACLRARRRPADPVDEAYETAPRESPGLTAPTTTELNARPALDLFDRIQQRGGLADDWTSVPAPRIADLDLLAREGLRMPVARRAKEIALLDSIPTLPCPPIRPGELAGLRTDDDEETDREC